jgi:hypothetical protein
MIKFYFKNRINRIHAFGYSMHPCAYYHYQIILYYDDHLRYKQILDIEYYI